MRFCFNERKAAQAAAFVLSRHGGSLNYMVLLKLLYMADRRALIERGLPITGDRMVSMPHGTALSTVLDLLKAKIMIPAWSRYVSSPNGYEVRSTGTSELDELSRYELSVLADIDDELGGKDWRELRQFTHDLPEWQDPAKSSLTIFPETILRKTGIPDDEIQRLDEESRGLEALHRAIGR
jgi:hypothetical protein